MINKIGLIYQDRNSRGLCIGLRDRLGCSAEIVEPPAAIGKSRVLTRRQAKLAWEYFNAKGVDLIVRFTDADRSKWQDIKRTELQQVPEKAKSLWICGIAVENAEDWLTLDPSYLAQRLGIAEELVTNPSNRTGTIKNALQRLTSAEAGLSDIVSAIVREAPESIFRQWLRDDALRCLYAECRAAANRSDCTTPNELDPATNG